MTYVLGEFTDDHALLAAARTLRARAPRASTSTPRTRSTGAEEALGLRRSTVPLVTLVGGRHRGGHRLRLQWYTVGARLAAQRRQPPAPQRAGLHPGHLRAGRPLRRAGHLLRAALRLLPLPAHPPPGLRGGGLPLGQHRRPLALGRGGGRAGRGGGGGAAQAGRGAGGGGAAGRGGLQVNALRLAPVLAAALALAGCPRLDPMQRQAKYKAYQASDVARRRPGHAGAARRDRPLRRPGRPDRRDRARARRQAAGGLAAAGGRGPAGPRPGPVRHPAAPSATAPWATARARWR